jgi:hypothetical protein
MVNSKYAISEISSHAYGNIFILRGADKSLAFPIYSTNKIIFLGWVKKVITTKS